jgi:hypothetical protein
MAVLCAGDFSAHHAFALLILGVSRSKRQQLDQPLMFSFKVGLSHHFHPENFAQPCFKLTLGGQNFQDVHSDFDVVLFVWLVILLRFVRRL